jgi:uncharacterized protein YPO0396
MPPAKRASTTKATTSRSAAAKKPAAARKTAAARKPAAKKSAGATKPAKAGSTTARSSAAKSAEERIDAVADRLRKLNERIIDAGRDAGESTLTSYEKALKAIAGSIERGPGSSDVEWIANLATAQAKFLREVTNSWTSAARDLLKK